MLPRDPIDTLLNENVALGLRLGPHTMTPGWLGERLDVAWAIDVLHPLALAERPEGRLRHSLDEPLGVADA